MHRPLRRLVAALALVFAAAPVGATGPRLKSSCPAPLPPDLPATTRGPIEPDVAALPSAPAGALTTPAAIRYRLLNERECQCRAVQFAPLAGTLARERQALAEAHPCCECSIIRTLLPRHCDDRANNLRRCILYYTELEIRNRSAGTALDLYFQIAEAEAKDDLLSLGRDALTGAYDQAKDVADKGFKLPIELASLQRQQLEAGADRIRLHEALLDLNGKLKMLIGQDDLPVDEWLWPASDFQISYEPIDPDAALRTALNQRAELQLLRTLSRDLDAKTLPVIREFLKGLNTSLGAQAQSDSPLGKLADAIKAILTSHALERALRSNQIDQLLAEREKAVTNEVRLALTQLMTHSRLVDLERQRVLAWQARVQEMQDRLAKSEATFLDVLQAKLDWYKSRAALTAGVMGWHRAYARLRLAQGVLVAECCSSSPQ
jgi:hypothetical protein